MFRNAIQNLAPSAFDRFGDALATEDFNGDEYADLAVRIPGYNNEGADSVGGVKVFKGSPAGLSLLGETFWQQGSNGVIGSAEPYDNFGSSLSAGDFNGDGNGDLAIGASGEGVSYNGSDVPNAGSVNILYGSSIFGGLTGSGDQILHRGLDDIVGTPEEDEKFGYSVIVADFNGDGRDDLAVSVPFQDGVETDQGYVQVFYSNGVLIRTTGQQLWTPGMVIGAPEANDLFGLTITAGDFDGNGFADLIVGAPHEGVLRDAVTHENAGALHAIYGTESGLSDASNQIWYQDIDGIPDVSEAYDYFAMGLAR